MAEQAPIRPIGDRVLVEPTPLPEEAAPGVIRPGTTLERPVEGTVVGVGRAVKDVTVGDRVLYGKYSGSQFKVDARELLIMREEEILGVIELATNVVLA